MIPSHILQAQQSGDVETPRAYYAQKIEQDPHNPTWLLLLGISYAQHREYSEAYVYLRKSLDLEVNANNLASLATVCTHLERHDEATGYFDQSLSLHPYAPIVHNNYGMHWMKVNDIERAMSHFHMAITQNPDTHEGYYNLGLCYMQQSEYVHAAKKFSQALALFPDHHTGHYQMGLCYELSHTWDQALTHYQQCNTIAKHALSLHGMGRCYIKLGDPGTALEHLKEAITFGDDSVEVWHNLAMCYHQLSAPAMALEAWLKAQKIQSTHDALYHIGVCYQQMYRYKEADEYFTEALAKDPEHLDTYLNLIALSIEIYNVDKALYWINTAQKYHPARDDLAYLKASITQKGDITKAPEAYISQLFDHYAFHYNQHVVDILQYQLPTLIHHALLEYKQALFPWENAYDLGCGTGLMGPIMRPHVHTLTGIDLSKDMLKVAASLDMYDHLIHKDILENLSLLHNAHLIVMAELLPYCGDLSWLHTLHTHLEHEGMVILSVEKNNTIPQYHLHQHARFHHNTDYVIESMVGFECIEIREITLRKHSNIAVFGALCVFKKK